MFTVKTAHALCDKKKAYRIFVRKPSYYDRLRDHEDVRITLHFVLATGGVRPEGRLKLLWILRTAGYSGSCAEQ